MTHPHYRMTRAATDLSATGTSVPGLAERLADDPTAQYQGGLPDEVGVVVRGVLLWGPHTRPGGARRSQAAVTLERVD
ncbi:hypothetical protein [Cellulomonas triticagri]|uniref:Uncharacterized protein n=1 Tax=Cellulomonas triticagri TaxID=2483352 RepID=A0A3M2IXZ5_9CELL|nr:hypothetical protein [Cellulomonas triticagri]RMI04716.1 hypothetical protein EBM89_17895 [Cellulomonas triticagri]